MFIPPGIPTWLAPDVPIVEDLSGRMCLTGMADILCFERQSGRFPFDPLFGTHGGSTGEAVDIVQDRTVTSGTSFCFFASLYSLVLHMYNYYT